LLGADRASVVQELRNRLNQAAQERQLGVEILYAGWVNLQPPVPTVDGYYLAIAASDVRQQLVLSAAGGAIAADASATAESGTIVGDARSYRYGREVVAQAEADNFTRLLSLYHSYPALFRERRYLEALEVGLRGKRKLIIATEHPDQVISVDLKDPEKTNLLNIAPP